MQADSALHANLEFNVKLVGEALFGQRPDWNKLRNTLSKNGLATAVIDQHRDEIARIFTADQAERCASSLKAQSSPKVITGSTSEFQHNVLETSQGQASRAVITDGLPLTMSILINSDTWTGVCYAWSSDKEESIIGQHIINRHSLQSRVKNSRIRLTFRPNKNPRTYEVEFKVQPNPGFDVCLGTDWSNEDRGSGGNIDKNKMGRQACNQGPSQIPPAVRQAQSSRPRQKPTVSQNRAEQEDNASFVSFGAQFACEMYRIHENTRSSNRPPPLKSLLPRQHKTAVVEYMTDSESSLRGKDKVFDYRNSSSPDTASSIAGSDHQLDDELFKDLELEFRELEIPKAPKVDLDLQERFNRLRP